MVEDLSADERAEVGARLSAALGRLGRLTRPPAGELTPAQLSALYSILQQEPIRVGDLARIESITAPTATRLVSALETAGMVLRTPDPVDGRASFLTATEAGRSAVRVSREQRAQRMAALFAERSDEEFSTILPALELFESVVATRLRSS